MNGIKCPCKSPKNSFSPSTVGLTVRLPSHRTVSKNGLSFKLLACGMYVIAAEQTKASLLTPRRSFPLGGVEPGWEGMWFSGLSVSGVGDSSCR